MPVYNPKSTEWQRTKRRGRLALGASINLLGLACLAAGALGGTSIIS